MRGVLFFVAVGFAACSQPTNPQQDVQSVDAANDQRSADAPGVQDVPLRMDAPASDVIPTDVPVADVPTTDVPATDVTVSDGGAEAVSTAHPYNEAMAAILNPERGFHRFNQLVGTTSLTSIRGSGCTMIQSNAMLDVARTGPIPAARIASFETALNAARTAGVKVALRFLYDDTAAGRDAPLALVLQHIGQLQPLLTTHSDVIAVMPAGFIGAWGEWHSSANGLTALDSQRQIVNALLAALPASRMIQLRTPVFKSGLYGTTPLDPAIAFTSMPAARVGHHNDCFLASDTDFGTYPSGMVARWQDYIAAETLYVPFGGETCAVHARAACSNAVAEMARLHMSYVNRDYRPEVIEGWRTGGCYAEIERRLGYRFVLRNASFPNAARRSQRFSFEATVFNDGFAPMFNQRPVVLVFQQGTMRVEMPLASADPRRWTPAMTSTIRETLRIPDAMAPGMWTVSLWLPDAGAMLRDRVEYAVQFSNSGTWDMRTGMNTLGTMLVE